MLTAALSLVFGGCCTNLYFLERLVRAQPDCGDLITLAQFTVTAAVSYINLSLHGRPMPKIRPWIVPSILYFVVSVLNNKVWAFNISVPLHSIIRSSGALITVGLGLLTGKRYRRNQILGVLIITAGVIGSTFRSGDGGSFIGLTLLIISCLLAGVQGILYEGMKADWRDSLFMVHFLCIPMFALLGGPIREQWHRFDSPGWLAANCVTQFLCTLGVNQLLQAGALTVNVTLTIRKFVSLLISAIVFGGVTKSMMVCGVAVAVGALVYAWPADRSSTDRSPASRSAGRSAAPAAVPSGTVKSKE